MRGAFIACLGGGPETWPILEDMATRFRSHGGKPSTHEAASLRVAVLADDDHGPTVAISGNTIRVVHGAEAATLEHLQQGPERFAAVESDGRRLLASRDALGEAPLFFRIEGGAAWFATEIHPLVAVAPAQPDLAALSADAGFVPHAMPTGWQGIFRVPPGSTASIDADLKVTVSAHWRPDRLLAKAHYTYPEAVDEFRSRFHQAVARRRNGATGVLLSGGLDSAAVAVAAGADGYRPRLVSVTFPEFPQTDESAYARATAESVGVPLGVEHGPTEPWDAEIEPQIFGAPSVLVPTGIFEVAANRFSADGVTTILDGHDGDGALGLYANLYALLVAHLEVRRLIGLARRYGWRSVAGPAVRETLGPWVRRIRNPFAPPHQPNSLISELLPYFSGPTARRMTNELRIRTPRATWRRWQLMPLTPPITLVFEQMETEAARLGVDVLHPFSDRDLLRFLVSLPFSVKADPERSKPLLRDGLADLLPESVRSRRDKVWFNPVLERRVDPTTCLQWIRESGVELPHFDYASFFRAVDSDPASLSVFAWIRLVRAHLFAAT